MSSIITGLFESQRQSKKISQDLENAGFANNDYIIYLHGQHVSKEVKTSVWQSFFKDNTKLEDESLVVTVRITDEDSIEKITRVFKDNHVISTNYFENIRFKDAMSLKYLKRIVSLRAKSQIYSTPEVRYHGQSTGMNSEVTFGKSMAT